MSNEAAIILMRELAEIHNRLGELVRLKILAMKSRYMDEEIDKELKHAMHIEVSAEAEEVLTGQDSGQAPGEGTGVE